MLPSVRFTLIQIGIGATDLVLVTLAMYTLLPPSPAVGFLPVLVIFVTATLLGTVSHVPGSLGVIRSGTADRITGIRQRGIRWRRC